MGEAKRLRDLGVQMKQVRPGEAFQVDVTNATPLACECGCRHFMPAVVVYTVSALMSPTGKELDAQRPVLLCVNCRKELTKGGGDA